MKTKFAFIVGFISAIGGMVFAAMAQSIAFNNVKGYSPPRSETSYGVQEQVLQNITDRNSLFCPPALEPRLARG